MIARVWRGWAMPANVARYRRHFEDSVRPHISALPGFRGCVLLQGGNGNGDEIEIVAVTLWETLDHIRAFAGDNIGVARVEPAARAVLTHYQTAVAHYEIASDGLPCIGIP